MEDPTNPHRRVPDARDPERRQFTHWAKLAPDGSVGAIVEVAVGHPPPVDAVYVEVTDLWPYTLEGATVDKAVLAKVAKDQARGVPATSHPDYLTLRDHLKHEAAHAKARS